MNEVYYRNFRQDLVEEIFPQVAKRMNLCSCQRCRADVMAIALNNMIPKYVASTKGETLARHLEFYTHQKTDVLRELIKTMMTVKDKLNYSENMGE